MQLFRDGFQSGEIWKHWVIRCHGNANPGDFWHRWHHSQLLDVCYTCVCRHSSAVFPGKDIHGAHCHLEGGNTYVLHLFQLDQIALSSKSSSFSPLYSNKNSNTVVQTATETGGLKLGEEQPNSATRVRFRKMVSCRGQTELSKNTSVVLLHQLGLSQIKISKQILVSTSFCKSCLEETQRSHQLRTGRNQWDPVRPIYCLRKSDQNWSSWKSCSQKAKLLMWKHVCKKT